MIAPGREQEKHRVLVIAAHPDDEILGCGGAMARHADRGDEVRLIILGEGITARDKDRAPERRQDELSKLQTDVRTAARIVGVHSVVTFSFPDNRFDTVPLLDLVKVVEDAKLEFEPSLVYTHFPNDLNIDHRQVARAVQTAFRPLPDSIRPTLLAFEVASSTEFQSPIESSAFRPNVYIEISTTLERKCKAMDAYRSERRTFPHPRSTEAIQMTAGRNGMEVGLSAAERFALVRAIYA